MRLKASSIRQCLQAELGRTTSTASFFSTLKTKCCARTVYRTKEQARVEVFDDIERFYNSFRKHSKLNFLSPVQFKERQRLKG